MDRSLATPKINPFDAITPEEVRELEQGPALEGASDVTLADRLQTAAGSGHPAADSAIRDAFLAPASWTSSAPVAYEGPKPTRVRTFEEAHRLRATFTGSSGGSALIDEGCLLVGQTLDGFRLESVTSDSAVFRSGMLRATLRLPGKTGLLGPGE